MKIAVIGATGLIGQHTVRAVLARGHELRVVHRPGSDLQSLEGLRFETSTADLADHAALKNACDGVDAIIHCAAYYPQLYGQLDLELATAREQMENFCAAAQASGCSKVIYISAASILNKPAEATLANETMLFGKAPTRSNPFRLIKWHMEQIAERYIAQGLPLVFAIPSMVFGEYDYGPTAGRLIVGIANGTMRNYIACQRNIIAGPDLAEGLMRCLEAGKVGERYILAGTNISFEELVQKIAAAAQVPMPKRVPLALATTLALLQTLRYRITGKIPGIKLSELRMLAAGKFLDTRKATQELGFTASTPVDTAIAEALYWFRSKGYIAQQNSI